MRFSWEPSQPRDRTRISSSAWPLAVRCRKRTSLTGLLLGFQPQTRESRLLCWQVGSLSLGPPWKPSPCSGFSYCGAQALWRAGSAAAVPGLSCLEALGGLLQAGIEPMSLALAGRFFTPGPPGEPPRATFEMESFRIPEDFSIPRMSTYNRKRTGGEIGMGQGERRSRGKSWSPGCLQGVASSGPAVLL